MDERQTDVYLAQKKANGGFEKAIFNKVFLRDRGKSGKAAYQTPTGGSWVPCVRITCKMPCCAVFLLNGQAHAQRSF